MQPVTVRVRVPLLPHLGVSWIPNDLKSLAPLSSVADDECVMMLTAEQAARLRAALPRSGEGSRTLKARFQDYNGRLDAFLAEHRFPKSAAPSTVTTASTLSSGSAELGPDGSSGSARKRANSK